MAYLKEFFLICLLLPISIRTDETTDFENLASIIEFLDNNYSPGKQYAAAINVPQEQCQNFKPLTDNFLINDTGDNIRNVIKGDKNPVYIGTELIAAGVQKDPPAHSEFLLLEPVNKSPLTYLLNNRNDGCVVFYTLNSPCMDTCLSGKYSIIPGVKNLKNYKGIKAFAFKNIWKHDQNKTYLNQNLRRIAHYVPLYRCENNINCTLCGAPNAYGIREECLSAA